MEVSSGSGFRQFHEERVAGGPHVTCRYLEGRVGGQSMERAEGARPEMRQNKKEEPPTCFQTCYCTFMFKKKKK